MPAKKKRKPLVTSATEDELLVHTYSLEQLIEGAINRSRAHVGELERRYGPALIKHIRWKDPEVTAQGVESEVFMRLPDALKTYEHRGKFEAFLMTIADRILIDDQRSRAGRPRAASDRVQVKARSSARRELEQRDLIERLAVALSPRARTIWLRHIDGYSNQDTANELGMTANAVGAALSRSRAVIRARAEELRLRPSDFRDSGLSSELILPNED